MGFLLAINLRSLRSQKLFSFFLINLLLVMKVKDTFAFWLIGIGAFFFLTLIMLFIWRDNSLFTTSAEINHAKFSSLGAIISGLVGTFWSLAGIILFYVALTEQRKDIKTNRSALVIQTNALKEQIKEFELQTKELESTRKIYIEQLTTQGLQRFESTFFQMVNLHNSIVSSMTVRSSNGKVQGSGVEGFQVIVNWLTQIWKSTENSSDPEISDIIVNYMILYDKLQHILGHYFRNLYHIFKFISRSDVEQERFYAALVRAQLSTFELLLILYNGLSINGFNKFKPLIEKYSVFKNLDWTLVNGGKETIKRYKPSAFGCNDYSFLDKVEDWQ